MAKRMVSASGLSCKKDPWLYFLSGRHELSGPFSLDKIAVHVLINYDAAAWNKLSMVRKIYQFIPGYLQLSSVRLLECFAERRKKVGYHPIEEFEVFSTLLGEGAEVIRLEEMLCVDLFKRKIPPRDILGRNWVKLDRGVGIRKLALDYLLSKRDCLNGNEDFYTYCVSLCKSCCNNLELLAFYEVMLKIARQEIISPLGMHHSPPMSRKEQAEHKEEMEEIRKNLEKWLDKADAKKVRLKPKKSDEPDWKAQIYQQAIVQIHNRLIEIGDQISLFRAKTLLEIFFPNDMKRTEILEKILEEYDNYRIYPHFG